MSHKENLFNWIKFGEIAIKLMKNALNTSDVDITMRKLLLNKAKEGYIPDPDMLAEEESTLLLSAALHREIARFISAASFKSKEFKNQALEAYLTSLVLFIIGSLNPKRRNLDAIRDEITRTLFELSYVANRVGNADDRYMVEGIRMFVYKILKYADKVRRNRSTER